MTIKDKLLPLDLTLFDGAAAGAGAGAAAGTGAGEGGTAATGDAVKAISSVAGKGKRANPLASVVYGKQDNAEPAAAEPAEESVKESQDAADSKPPIKTTSDTLEARKAEFERLINGEYKDIFTERVQSIIDKRFKETKTLEAKLDKLQPVIYLLSSKYGESDIDKLAKAIEEDDAFYEQEAMEKGLTVEQLKQIKKMEKENVQLKKAMEELERRQQADRIYSQWMQEAEQLKQIYPHFDLQAEMQNPDFVKLLRAGVPLKAAYQSVHMDEILGGAMYYAAQKTQEQVINDIKARGSRPVENGISQQTGVVVKSDVTQLSPADRQEIARRAKRGEVIKF